MIAHQAQSLAATLPPLMLEARQVAATVQQGVHGRRRAGPGEGFWQYRRYQAGDPASIIDWRQSAKADPLYVQETEWSAAQSIWLWSDHSPSMRWRSEPTGPLKQDRADLLLLALAIGLVGSGERVALLGLPAPPAADPGAPDRLAAALTTASGTAWPVPSGAIARHAQVLLFSDFLMPLPAIDSKIRRLAENGLSGHLVQVLDRAEEILPYDGRIIFEGLEGEGDMLADHAQSLRVAYRQAMAAHRGGLKAIAAAIGWGYTLHHTDAPPTVPLVALHAALARH